MMSLTGKKSNWENQFLGINQKRNEFLGNVWWNITKLFRNCQDFLVGIHRLSCLRYCCAFISLFPKEENAFVARFSVFGVAAFDTQYLLILADIDIAKRWLVGRSGRPISLCFCSQGQKKKGKGKKKMVP